MKQITSMMSQWKAVDAEGESLYFKQCKGGYFSTDDEYGLKFIGKTAQEQCVKAGTKIICCGKNLFDISSLPQTASNISVDGNIVTLTKYACMWTNDVKSLFNSMGIRAGSTITVSRKREIKEGTTNNVRGRMTLSGKDTTINSSIILIEGSQDYRATTFADDFDINNYVALIVYGETGGLVEISDIQFELGDTATDYEPYNGNTITSPCDLYEGDIWYPTSGLVVRQDRTEEKYDIQKISMPQGTVNVVQSPTELTGTLQGYALVRR